MSSEEVRRPARVALDVDGREVVFLQVAGDRYSAELDGRRCSVRVPGGGGTSAGPDPRETTDLSGLLRCLAHAPERHAVPHGLKLSATDNWGHFRQNTFITVTVTIAADGAIELACHVEEQDESFY